MPTSPPVARPGTIAPEAPAAAPKIGVLVVAYNATGTLSETLDRIPTEFRPKISEIFICDDASVDGTFEAGRAWQRQNASTNTTVIRHLKNLGYGGNQKAGYQLALERGLDVVVLLHADGQYAPELLPDIVRPLEEGHCDAVLGSRMMVPGAARRGGMPLYKYVGNRVLTGFENRFLDADLSEFHSGYRAYRVSALADLPLRHNSNGFDFDTQIIIQLLDRGKRIVEVPIPTFYGDEICYVNGLRYARDVVRDVLQYRLGRMGFGQNDWVPADDEYDLKEGEGSSHSVILDMLAGAPAGRVLDLGCSGGRLANRIRESGHVVTGVDSHAVPGVQERVDRFVQADLEEGIPSQVGGPFDVVIAADVIEHVRRPSELLRQMSSLLAPGGQILISTPNFGHWYPRVRVALGAFDYDRRGILDDSHLRFFSRRSLLKLVQANGFDIEEVRSTGLPFESLASESGRVVGSGHRLDMALVKIRPTLFAYQFVLRLRPHHVGSYTTDGAILPAGA